MCLRIAKDQEVKVAQEDIVCYKVLKQRIDGLTSPYQKMAYEKGRVMYAKIGTPEKMLVLDIFGIDSKNCLGIEEGLHSFMDKESAEQFYFGGLFNMKVCVAVIPKGAEYYEGTFDLYRSGNKHAWPSYVSSQLYIKEIL